MCRGGLKLKKVALCLDEFEEVLMEGRLAEHLPFRRLVQAAFVKSR